MIELYSREEHEVKMTIYYNKRLGTIKSIIAGIQDMSVYGTEQQDYTLIYDCIVIDKDDYVMKNMELFKINTETKQLEMLPSVIPNYPIASQ